MTQRDREVPASGAADSADPLTAASAKNETFQDMVPDLPTTTNLLQPLTFFLNKSLDDSRFLINEDIRVLYLLKSSGKMDTSKNPTDPNYSQVGIPSA